MIKQRCKSYMYVCLTFVNGSIVLAIVLTIDNNDHNHPKDHWTPKTGYFEDLNTPAKYRFKTFHWRVQDP